MIYKSAVLKLNAPSKSYFYLFQKGKFFFELSNLGLSSLSFLDINFPLYSIILVPFLIFLLQLNLYYQYLIFLFYIMT